MLNTFGYSLQTNVKARELSSHLDRDAQFRYLMDKAKRKEANKQPIISLVSKKRELVDDSRAPGVSVTKRASR